MGEAPPPRGNRGGTCTIYGWTLTWPVVVSLPAIPLFSTVGLWRGNRVDVRDFGGASPDFVKLSVSGPGLWSGLSIPWLSPMLGQGLAGGFWDIGEPFKRQHVLACLGCRE